MTTDVIEPRAATIDGELASLVRQWMAAEPVEQAGRTAVLIDAGRVSDEVATGLFEWVEHLRRDELHSFHHYAADDDQALVAMALDAVDLAHDASVEEVVLAGDLTSMLPLVHRLDAAGVRVVAVGAAHTPHEVRAACHEFVDSDSLVGGPVVPQGRHRAG